MRASQALVRSTPILLGLFSLVTLLATRLVRDGRLLIRTAAWYVKSTPSFNEALAAVRRRWWHATTATTSAISRRDAEMIELRRHLVRRLSNAFYYAA